MAPTPEQVQVAIQALYDEAGTWRASTGVMGTAAAAARGLSLGPLQMSWAASITGLGETYAEIQNKIATLLVEGENNFERIGQSLRTAADGYERDEQDALHRLRGIY